mmetsp:Transcript_18028/g.36369  ORF Transcript_18028/g.36369 Transcript_18028/m.36369 type:complete len:247 (+) Transcript_18028:240-980(+)
MADDRSSTATSDDELSCRRRCRTTTTPSTAANNANATQSTSSTTSSGACSVERVASCVPACFSAPCTSAAPAAPAGQLSPYRYTTPPSTHVRREGFPLSVERASSQQQLGKSGVTVHGWGGAVGSHTAAPAPSEHVSPEAHGLPPATHSPARQVSCPVHKSPSSHWLSCSQATHTPLAPQKGVLAEPAQSAAVVHRAAAQSAAQLTAVSTPSTHSPSPQQASPPTASQDVHPAPHPTKLPLASFPQ